MDSDTESQKIIAAKIEIFFTYLPPILWTTDTEIPAQSTSSVDWYPVGSQVSRESWEFSNIEISQKEKKKKKEKDQYEESRDSKANPALKVEK